MRAFLLLVFSLLIGGCAAKEPYVRLAQDTLPKTTTITVKGVAEGLAFIIDEKGLRIEKSTFPVMVRGAGVFISEENHVLTCDHLFTLPIISSITTCNYYGECSDAEILFRDGNLDLALLHAKFPYKSDAAKIGNPLKLRVGQEVLAVGNPLGFPFSVSHGILSALNRNELGVYNMTQSDAFINPGNSGGGLFNMRGELIGINSRMVPPVRAAVFTGLGFSVQSGQILEFLTRFRGLDEVFSK